MRVGDRQRRTIERAPDGRSLLVLDQTKLPFEIEWVTLGSLADAARAIKTMIVRGAPLIGATAAYGLALGLLEDPSDDGLRRAYARLLETRPTAVNLRWALDEVVRTVGPQPPAARAELAYAEAAQICDDDARMCEAIGEHGLALFRGFSRPVNVLTHCNAGWLATVDWGTALAPIYKAHAAGIPVHVWVDETRPRNQGASLTAWELQQEGVPHTLIADNAGGHLMQHGKVDLVIVGSDRTTADGDVCNKIGTYLKALAAKDNGVPFYAAVPGSTLDFSLRDGVREIVIEERDGDELRRARALTRSGAVEGVQLVPASTPVANPAFDVTPSRLVTGIVTERGLCPATAEGLRALYPERA